MKIFLANSSKQSVGGGWSFISNFRKAMGEHVTDNYDEAEHFLISGASMVQREEVEKAKQDGKKVVLRIDNALRNSRNRNTGMTRMKDFAQQADLVIYQSHWARKYLMPFLKRDGAVIHNSVDTDIFNTHKKQLSDHLIYIYTRYNRDETKNWEVARYWFSRQKGELWIIGNFSPELINGNFDFYMNENYKYWGVVPPEQMADLYKQANYLVYPYFNDACSNTLIEALCCGLKLAGPDYFWNTGGSPEIKAWFEDPFTYKDGFEYFGLKRMARQYKEVLGIR